jgi:hypothetical protein
VAEDLERLTIAPPEELVRYLAIFRRFLRSFASSSRSGDRQRLILAGWIADALHNVPGLLYRYEPKVWSSPEQIDRWVRAFPRSIGPRGAPAEIAAECLTIFAHHGASGELALRAGLSKLNVAPPEKMKHYLRLLYGFCLDTRTLRSYSDPCAPWGDVNSRWDDQGDSMVAFYGLVAEVLLPIPRALVHWSTFDERAFWHSTLSMDVVLRNENAWREHWRARCPEDVRLT